MFTEIREARPRNPFGEIPAKRAHGNEVTPDARRPAASPSRGASTRVEYAREDSNL